MSDDHITQDRKPGSLGGNQAEDQMIADMQGVSAEKGRGNWMQVYPARKFWPLDPQPHEICFDSIVQSLSTKARYNGHCKFPLWVAQHAYYIARAALKRSDGDPLMGLAGLHHDDAEAYLPDVPRPHKPMMPEFYAIEAKVDAAIVKRFNFPFEPWPELIRELDNSILYNEGRDCLIHPIEDWHCTFEPGIPELTIEPWTWQEAKQRFTFLHNRLMHHWENRSRVPIPGYSVDHMGRR